jgi:hypothetical protein
MQTTRRLHPGYTPILKSSQNQNKNVHVELRRREFAKSPTIVARFVLVKSAASKLHLPSNRQPIRIRPAGRLRWLLHRATPRGAGKGPFD